MGTCDEAVIAKLPLAAQPWANLFNFVLDKVHQVGLTGTAIALLVGAGYYAYPLAKEQVELQKGMQVQLETLKVQAEKAMPMLEEATKAIPILQEINRTSVAASKARHVDAVDAASALLQKTE